ncbi:DUF1211 domain-containing protein [Arthrobacter gandavensis]|uniref:TMEM175 family protein n=1 Tax=Arthrobacter gandavensis TaxID=169960 RepID=UPI00188F9007|nr:TMEM175 family protein [Arthrobacter gandavensis]MBF4994940.1 DUF1211 domain-containing protein [Arthrobacter gandavensis]
MGASPEHGPQRPGEAFDRSSVEFGRSVSFFDAIYGFAITLLVTNIDLPPARSWSSMSALLDSGLISQIFGFLLSFVVIAVFWRVNYRITAGILLMTPPVIVWNTVAAFFIVLLPFTTQGTSDPGTSDFALPTALYAANIALASLAQAALRLSARRQGRVPGARTLIRLAQALPHATVPAVFLASIPVTFLAGPGPGRLVWASLLVLGPLTGRLEDKARPGA